VGATQQNQSDLRKTIASAAGKALKRNSYKIVAPPSTPTLKAPAAPTTGLSFFDSSGVGLYFYFQLGSY
jgi:hypothetical protein